MNLRNPPPPWANRAYKYHKNSPHSPTLARGGWGVGISIGKCITKGSKTGHTTPLCSGSNTFWPVANGQGKGVGAERKKVGSLARGTRTWKGWGCSSEILNKPLKETDHDVMQAFLIPKRPCWNTDKWTEFIKRIKNIRVKYIFHISSRATLNETFTAKYNVVLPRTL